MDIVSDPNATDFQKFRALGSLVNGLYDEVSANPINWIPIKHRGKAIGMMFGWAGLVTLVLIERLLIMWENVKSFF